MAFIRRKWTPEDADEWTKEDLIASILSVLTYVTLSIGLALALFGMWQGYVLFLGG